MQPNYEHELIIRILRASLVEIGMSLRQATPNTDRRYDLGRVWDHIQDAANILADLDLREPTGGTP
jgi:hypothetical protein